MTSKGFNLLSGGEQYETTIQHGVEVATRQNTYFHMILYRVCDFHVEFKRRLADGELWIGLIDHEILLVPYLDQIELSELH